MGKYRPLNKNYLEVFLIVLILGVGLYVRLLNLHYPFQNLEASKDYLVARHIVYFGEVPTVGPWNSLLTGAFRNSPLYYYILAAIVFVQDSLLAISIVNIVLQIAAAFFIYLTGRYLFSSATGLLAAFLFTTSAINLVQSGEMWQPYLMQSFVSFAYALFALGLAKKEVRFVYFGSAIFAVSGALHNSAYPLFPVVLLAAYFSAKKKRLRSIIVSSTIFFVTLLVFYLPNIYTYFKEDLEMQFVNSLQGLTLESFWTNVELLVSALYKPKGLSGLPMITLFLAGVALLRSKVRERALILSIFGAILIIPLSLSSSGIAAHLHYFAPVFGLSFIFVVEVVRGALGRSWLFFPLSVAALYYLGILNFDHSRNLRPLPYETEQNALKITDLLAQEIETEKEKRKDKNYTFFNIEFFYPQDPKVGLNAFFWVNLEKRLGEKFTVVGNFNNGFEVANRDEFVFIVCKDYQNNVQACTNRAKGYKVEKKLFDEKPFVIYTAVKEPS